MNKHTLNIIFVSALLLTTLSACSSSPAPHLYIIEPMSASAGTQIDNDLRIGVGPVTLPELLNRKEIVTHDQRYRVNSAEFDRWAEPLDHNVTNVLAENLSVLIPSDQIIAYPWDSAHDFDFTVQVRVITFGTNPSGEVVLRASWIIYDAANEPVELTKKRYAASRRGNEVVALVAAMSQTIEQLSRDIATSLVAASAESPR
jgi:uncharacterized protein